MEEPPEEPTNLQGRPSLKRTKSVHIIPVLSPQEFEEARRRAEEEKKQTEMSAEERKQRKAEKRHAKKLAKKQAEEERRKEEKERMEKQRNVQPVGRSSTMLIRRNCSAILNWWMTAISWIWYRNE